MRRRTKALVGIAVLVVITFTFLAPIVYVQLGFAECGYGCFTHDQYISLSAVLIGHGGYYFEGQYSVH